MRLKSAFTGFISSQLVMGSGVTILMLVIFFVASSFKKSSNRDLRAKQVNLIVRQIGHRLLLQAGDRTSRVLPVTEIKEGTFLLRFENEFVFNHDSLIAMSHGLLPKTNFASGYTVTVHDCKKGSIVYGFQLNNTSPDILACSGRTEPIGCYTVEFAFADLYVNAEQKGADNDQLIEGLKPAKVDPQKINAQPGEIKITTSDYDINQTTKELKSFKGDPQEANTEPKELKTTASNFPLTNVVYAGMLVMLVVTLLIGRFGKSLRPVPEQKQSHATMKNSVPEASFLGKFLFDLKGQRLSLGTEVISLTDKECKVLELLYQNFGELMPRETLMQKVWIDEGVITGRSLDMFVSKLRKKLSSDPELKITNVHGKGYKLETPGIQIS